MISYSKIAVRAYSKASEMGESNIVRHLGKVFPVGRDGKTEREKGHLGRK
jgi:hypothetical protein